MTFLQLFHLLNHTCKLNWFFLKQKLIKYFFKLVPSHLIEEFEHIFKYQL
jgi:hypothetical protein